MGQAGKPLKKPKRNLRDIYLGITLSDEFQDVLCRFQDFLIKKWQHELPSINTISKLPNDYLVVIIRSYGVTPDNQVKELTTFFQNKFKNHKKFNLHPRKLSHIHIDHQVVLNLNDPSQYLGVQSNFGKISVLAEEAARKLSERGISHVLVCPNPTAPFEDGVLSYPQYELKIRWFGALEGGAFRVEKRTKKAFLFRVSRLENK